MKIAGFQDEVDQMLNFEKNAEFLALQNGQFWQFWDSSARPELPKIAHFSLKIAKIAINWGSEMSNFLNFEGTEGAKLKKCAILGSLKPGNSGNFGRFWPSKIAQNGVENCQNSQILPNHCCLLDFLSLTFCSSLRLSPNQKSKSPNPNGCKCTD